MNTLRRLSGAEALLLFLAFSGAGCVDDDPTPVASPELLEAGADHVMFDLVQQVSVNGIREGRVEADTAFAFSDSTLYTLRGPILILYDEQGRERARVISKRGRFNYATKELVARGDVVLTIPAGDKRVETQELNYDPNGDRIWSDSATVMHEAGRVIRGMGFSSDLDFRRMQVGPGSIRGARSGGGAPSR
jgi:LPS export ABC transporter protein LptC